MCRKLRLKMLVLTALLILPFVFGGTGDVCARGGSDPAPPGLTLKPGRLEGILLVELLEILYDFEIRVRVTFVGDYLAIVGTFPVAIGPLDRTITQTEGSFTEATIRDLEGWEFTGIGPDGLFSEEGGENLIITRVKSLYNTIFSDGTRVIGAKVIVRALK